MALAVVACTRGMLVDGDILRPGEWADYGAMEIAFVSRDTGNVGSGAWSGVLDSEFIDDVVIRAGKNFYPMGCVSGEAASLIKLGERFLNAAHTLRQ